jgi:hypothetical protein
MRSATIAAMQRDSKPLTLALVVVLGAHAACSSDVTQSSLASSGAQGGGSAESGGASAQGGAGGAAQGGAAAGGSAEGGAAEGGAAAGGGTSTGPEPIVCASDSACTGCVANACPEAWCGCTEEPECGALFGCFQQCGGSEPCNQECLSLHAAGISSVLLVSDCASTQCASDCPMADTTLTPCERCLYTDCSAEMNACLSTPDCLGLLECLQGCSGGQLTCQQQCYGQFPTGAMPLEAVIGCSESQCPTDCPG